MEQPTKMTMGAMLAALRKGRGMTQAELAEQMGVTDKAVSKWERDISCPDVNVLPRLAELFGVSVDELLQARSVPAQRGGRVEIDRVLDLVFKAVALAMGVAVVVLSALRKLDFYSGFSLMGLGLTCAGISLLRNKS